MVVGASTVSHDVVVIGAGPGGYHAAHRLAHLGRDVLVVEALAVDLGVDDVAHQVVPRTSPALLDDRRQVLAHRLRGGEAALRIARSHRDLHGPLVEAIHVLERDAHDAGDDRTAHVGAHRLRARNEIVARRTFNQNREKAATPMLAAIGLGTFFVAFQGVEWVMLIGEGLTLTSSALGGFFYLIVGIHALHAVAAILLLVRTWLRLRRGWLASSQLASAEAFWYFVVALWPILYWRVYL